MAYDVQCVPVFRGFASASNSSRTIGSDPLSDAIFKAVPFRCGPHLRSTTWFTSVPLLQHSNESEILLKAKYITMNEMNTI